MNLLINSMKKFFLHSVIFILLPVLLIAQQDTETYKKTAMAQMQQGRYGEAIDLLNRYISANPNKEDGYNLRGLCYENRDQLELAVYDFRLARKLAPNNREINENLSRATDKWYKQLYLKIDGHRREIAIDPSKAINYLEIGKCYKHLGQWELAEQWYDESLKREDFSRDECIRYTEILAKNNHIEKGEKILKRFVEMYPEDHRLWSRYGYFTMWLGKRKIAEEAFLKALALRPYFKEAMDGLDIVRGKEYTYTIHDTAYKKREQEKPQEYAIDKYYRILKNKPEDDETRFLLIEELWKVNRLEEAYDQLNFLYPKHSGTSRFDNLYSGFMAYRDSIYLKRVEDIELELEKNPTNKEALKEYGRYMSNLERYDLALEAYFNYFDKVPNETDLDLRFRFAQLAAWERDFTTALEQVNYVLAEKPNNLEYQLFKGQVLVWTSSEPSTAKNLLENVFNSDPKNFQALIALGSVEVQLENFDKATYYANLAAQINPNDPAVTNLEYNIELQRLRVEQEKLYAILEEGRRIAMDGDCEAAISRFEEYLSKTEPNRSIEKEYADVLACAKRFDQALVIYNDLLSVEYNAEIDVQRAKVYFWNNQFDVALVEFKRLHKEYPDDFFINLFLADSYAQTNEPSEARDIYDYLLETTTDTSLTALVHPRLSWLPVTGLNAFFASFPQYMQLYPDFYYFEDNVGFVMNLQTVRLEIGALDFLSLGAGVHRGYYTNYNNAKTNFNMLKWGAYFRLSKNILAGIQFGSKKYRDGISKDIAEGFFYIDDSLYAFRLNYFNTDAVDILYSKSLPGSALMAISYRADGFWIMKSGVKLSANYNRIKISDGNRGEVFEFRVGKEFYVKGLMIGYEYNTLRFGRVSALYYSPKNFESHSLWVDWLASKTSRYSLNLGGKVGLIPDNDFMVSEVYGLLKYQLIEGLFLQARASVSNSFREFVGYNSRSFNISLSWQL